MQYKKLFITEASSKLKEIEDYLIESEKSRAAKPLIEKTLIALHSLKGYAATMNYLRLANAVHETEEFFLAVKNGSSKLTNELLDQLFILIDAFRSDLTSIEQKDVETDLTNATAFLFRKKSSTARKDVIAPKEKTNVQQAEPQDSTYEPLRSYVETPTHDLAIALEQVNTLIATQQHLQRQLQRKDIGSVQIALHNSLSTLSNLRQDIVHMKMVPVRQYFAFLARLVRDRAREGRKFISFEFNDHDLRLEQPVLESVNELCVQLVRNALEHAFVEGDHGVLAIDFALKSQMLTITVRDTGRGIQWGALMARARELGKLPKSKPIPLTPNLKEELLFVMSLSSSKQASLAAGRGIGLGIVRSNVAKMRGTLTFVSATSGASHGTTFVLSIPIQMTMFRAVTWRWGSYCLALPLFVLEKIIQLPHPEERHGVRYSYQKKVVPLLDFQSSLKLAGDFSGHHGSLAIVTLDDKKVALCLPARVHEEELILESLPVLSNNQAVSGVAVGAASVPVVVINHRVFFNAVYGKG